MPLYLKDKPAPMIPSDGIYAIGLEQIKQRGKGFSPEHDAQHRSFELAIAAACYAYAAKAQALYGNEALTQVPPPQEWPFEPEAWKPGRDAKATLAKAGALIALSKRRRHERAISLSSHLACRVAAHGGKDADAK